MALLLLALVGSYLIGSFPTAYVLVKWLKRVDVRSVGSGNVGATNVSRVAGLKAGLVVFLVDAGKGLLAVLVIAPWLLQPFTPAAQLACGLSAVIGHNFPLFLQFKGGKGVATTIGVLLAAMPLVGGIYLLTWVAGFVIWRYVSVASLAAALTIPLAQLLLHHESPRVLLGASLALLILVRHRANIARLVQGTEPRAGQKHDIITVREDS